ncbi:uncharacterized protein LOC111126816 [Crassostrea virginica]
MAFGLVFLIPICWALSVLSDDSVNPCLHHSTLSSENRSPHDCLPSDNNVTCDEDLDAEKWYRIYNITGNDVDITQECPTDLCRCNTVFPMWMRDPIPSTTNDTVDRLVCIKRNSGCCEGNVTVKVKNCGDFRVYKLKKPHGCPQGYCFGESNVADAKYCDNENAVKCPRHWSTAAHSSKAHDHTSDVYNASNSHQSTASAYSSETSESIKKTHESTKSFSFFKALSTIFGVSSDSQKSKTYDYLSVKPTKSSQTLNASDVASGVFNAYSSEASKFTRGTYKSTKNSSTSKTADFTSGVSIASHKSTTSAYSSKASESTNITHESTKSLSMYKALNPTVGVSSDLQISVTTVKPESANGTHGEIKKNSTSKATGVSSGVSIVSHETKTNAYSFVATRLTSGTHKSTKGSKAPDVTSGVFNASHEYKTSAHTSEAPESTNSKHIPIKGSSTLNAPKHTYGVSTALRESRTDAYSSEAHVPTSSVSGLTENPFSSKAPHTTPVVSNGSQVSTDVSKFSKAPNQNSGVSKGTHGSSGDTSSSNASASHSSDSNNHFPVWLTVLITLVSLALVFVPCLILYKKRARQHEKNKVNFEELVPN